MIKSIKELKSTVGILNSMRVRQNVFFCTKEEYDNLINEVSDRGKNDTVYGVMKESEKSAINIFGTLMYCGINFIFIETLN